MYGIYIPQIPEKESESYLSSEEFRVYQLFERKRFKFREWRKKDLFGTKEDFGYFNCEKYSSEILYFIDVCRVCKMNGLKKQLIWSDKMKEWYKEVFSFDVSQNNQYFFPSGEEQVSRVIVVQLK